MKEKRYIDIVVADTSNKAIELEKESAWQQFMNEVDLRKELIRSRQESLRQESK